MVAVLALLVVAEEEAVLVVLGREQLLRLRQVLRIPLLLVLEVLVV